MSKPSADEMSRSLSDLKACAESWRNVGHELEGKANSFTDGAHGGGALSFGLFIAAAGAMGSAAEATSTASRTGGQTIAQVGDTLEAVRSAYEIDEQNHVHESQGKW